MKSITTECGRQQIIEVKEEDYNKWKSGTIIQDAFPYNIIDF